MENYKSLRIAIPLLLAAGCFAAPASAQLACNVSTNQAKSPYNLSKFRTAISNSQRLQIDADGNSSNVPECLSNTDMKNYKIDGQNFYLEDQNLYIGFWAGLPAYRVELRGYSFAGNSTNKQFTSKIKVRRDTKTSPQYTVAQIFAEGSPPILRVEMIADRQGIKNHFWAVYRFGTGSNQSTYKDLGAAQTTYVPLNMTYNTNSQIRVEYNGKVVTFDENFGIWSTSTQKVHFKTGCYLQDGGDCEVRYSSLNFNR